MEKVTIGIIDDHQIVRQGLKALLEKIGPYRVTMEYDCAQTFLESLPLENAPKLFIMDYLMRGSTGTDVLKQLENEKDEYKVLILTKHFDEKIIDELYRHGARGFLHKNCTTSDLKLAIDNIIKIGYTNITEILQRVRHYDEYSTLNGHAKIVLSAREAEFLRLVCDEREYTYEQMADIMGLSVKSIEAYRSHLFDRFGIKSKVGLVLFSFKHKLTAPFV